MRVNKMTIDEIVDATRKQTITEYGSELVPEVLQIHAICALVETLKSIDMTLIDLRTILHSRG